MAVAICLLMHDIGKGSGRDHTEEARGVARAVMERLGAPEADRETIEFLVLRHLDLSSVMSSRDLYDGSTARALAERVGTLERLKQLTMLTYADISAVNPQAMTPWRMEQLWRVYLMAYEELTRELVAERIHDRRRDAGRTGPVSGRAADALFAHPYSGRGGCAFRAGAAARLTAGGGRDASRARRSTN